MDMPTVTETTSPSRGAGPTPGRERTADAARAGRPQLTESVVHGGAADRPDRPHGRDGAATHVHVHGGGTANRVLSDKARQMLKNLDEHGDINGPGEGKPAREGTSTTGVTVVESAGGKAAAPEKPATTAETPEKQPAEGDKPATGEPAKDTPPAEPEKQAAKPVEAPAAPDPKLAAEIERLQTHNRKLVSELEARTGAPVLDDRHKALDEIERSIIPDPIGAMERLFALSIGAKDHTDPRVQKFMAGVYGDWTERELKVPMDRAARAEFGTERNRLLIERDKRDRETGEKSAAEKSKAAERERTVRDTVTTLDRQLVEAKHGEKFPHLMQSELFDGITPGQRLFTAIAQGIAAGDWDKVPGDDKLVEHYSTKLNKELEARDQKLRAHYAPKQPTTSTATPTPASEPSKDKAADAPAQAEQAGVRTITNASASVAPPTPPKEAAPAIQPKDDKPKWRNEAERRVYLARKHFEGVET